MIDKKSIINKLILKKPAGIFLRQIWVSKSSSTHIGYLPKEIFLAILGQWLLNHHLKIFFSQKYTRRK
jgi:hypothetical protein